MDCSRWHAFREHEILQNGWWTRSSEPLGDSSNMSRLMGLGYLHSTNWFSLDEVFKYSSTLPRIGHFARHECRSISPLDWTRWGISCEDWPIWKFHGRALLAIWRDETLILTLSVASNWCTPENQHDSGKSPFSIGNTSSNGRFSIVMSVFRGVHLGTLLGTVTYPPFFRLHFWPRWFNPAFSCKVG